MSKKREFVSTSALSAFLDITGRIDNETRDRVREREREKNNNLLKYLMNVICRRPTMRGRCKERPLSLTSRMITDRYLCTS